MTIAWQVFAARFLPNGTWPGGTWPGGRAGRAPTAPRPHLGPQSAHPHHEPPRGPGPCSRGRDPEPRRWSIAVVLTTTMLHRRGCGRGRCRDRLVPVARERQVRRTARPGRPPWYRGRRARYRPPARPARAQPGTPRKRNAPVAHPCRWRRHRGTDGWHQAHHCHPRARRDWIVKPGSRCGVSGHEHQAGVAAGRRGGACSLLLLAVINNRVRCWWRRYGRTGRVYSRRMLLPRREMSAP